jgi:hypothetical protein
MPDRHAPLSDPDLNQALEVLRSGSQLTLGGSRAHSTWGFHEGWYRADFDEGREETSATSEADVRRQLMEHPSEARDLLWAAARRGLPEAFRAGDEIGVRRVVAACANYRDPSPDDAILVALVAPSASLGPAERAALRDHVSGFTFYHLVTGALGGRRTPEDGRAALGLLDRALRLVGEPKPEGVERLRASFERMASALA